MQLNLLSIQLLFVRGNDLEANMEAEACPPKTQIYFSNLFDGRQYTLLVLLAKAECNIVLLNLDNENLSHPKV